MGEDECDGDCEVPPPPPPPSRAAKRSEAKHTAPEVLHARAPVRPKPAKKAPARADKVESLNDKLRRVRIA